MIKQDLVIKVLFENFCESCELGEEGCIDGSKVLCPVFRCVQDLCPLNPFVIRIMGRHMRCRQCDASGLTVPTSPLNVSIQPVYVCLNCGAALWRGRYGMLVECPEDINRSFAIRFVDENGALIPREVDID